MRTTVEIPDSLLVQARAVAARERTTLRALIAEGLRRILGERRRPRRFRLRRVTIRGKGLRRGFRGASWERIRDRTYEGRGS